MIAEDAIFYDTADEPELDELVEALHAMDPVDLRAEFDAKSPEQLLSSSAVLQQLGQRDPAYFGESPGQAKDLLDIVVATYRKKTGQN